MIAHEPCHLSGGAREVSQRPQAFGGRRPLELVRRAHKEVKKVGALGHLFDHTQQGEQRIYRQKPDCYDN